MLFSSLGLLNKNRTCYFLFTKGSNVVFDYFRNIEERPIAYFARQRLFHNGEIIYFRTNATDCEIEKLNFIYITSNVCLQYKTDLQCFRQSFSSHRTVKGLILRAGSGQHFVADARRTEVVNFCFILLLF